MTEKKPMRTNATPARTTARQPEPSPKAAAKEHLTASETPDEAIATDSPEPEAKSTPKATSKRKTEASTAVDAGVTNYTFTTSWPKTGGPKAANCTLGPPQACAWFAARVPSVPLKILQPGMFHC